MNERINENDIPNGLGVQLVDILYANTNLNYDVCALNLVEIFEHLNRKIPKLDVLSKVVINSIQNATTNRDLNPDLLRLDHNLKHLHELNGELQSGEKNFYECNSAIEKSTKDCINLLAKQTNANVFRPILIENRQAMISLYELWQLSSDKTIKNGIIVLFNISSQSDPVIMRLLFENTNLASELCCLIKQDIVLSDHKSLIKSFKCLIRMIVNSSRMPVSFIDFLKSTDTLNIIFDTIETENSFLYLKINDEHEDERKIYLNHHNNHYQQQQQHDNNSNKFIRNQELNQTVFDMFIHLILALNKRFLLPEENLIVNFINLNQESILNRKFLSECVINLFNFETDPLLSYKIESDSIENDMSLEELNIYYTNSTLKFLSDLFSLPQTIHSTSIFYLNDFNVLIDVIIRKLANLGPNDQIRVDYLSLIQLIIKNSNYMESMYRKDDLIQCFKSILNEKDQHTIDQDIVRIIIAENPQLKF